MADLTLVNSTLKSISPARINECRIRPVIASVAIDAGDSLCNLAATGRAAKSNSTSAGDLAEFRGLALNKVGPGGAISMLEEGYTDAFEITALAYDAPVYLSDTPGKIGTTAGTVSIVVGKVVAASDKDPATGLPSKLLFIKTNLL